MQSLTAIGGRGGTGSVGARYPFFVFDAEREPDVKKPFAFGADATLRKNLVADAPIALGDRGLGRECGVELPKDDCEVFAVCGLLLARGALGLRDIAIRCFSDFVRTRCLSGPASARTSVEAS